MLSIQLLIGAMHTSNSVGRDLCRTLFFVLAVALVLPVLHPSAQGQDAAEPNSRHMLWRVTSETGATDGYLVGSVHVMKEDAYALDAAFDEAFAESDALVVEANLDSMQTKAQSLVRQLALYPPGKTLESELSSDTYTMLEKRAEKIGLNLGQMQRLEPWMVSITIPTRQMQQAGYAQNKGVDRYFFDKAKAGDKPIAAFETAKQQLRFFDDLPPEKQESYLRHSLEEADRTVDNIDKIVRHWKNGNVDGMEKLMVDQMQTDTPALYETLITERNENWMSRLTELLDGDKRPMVVVGAGHVVGESGLVEMLKAQGYQLQQL